MICKVFGFIRTHAKKCALAVAGVFGLAAPAVAQESSTGPDLTPAVNALTTMKDAIVGQNGWVAQAAPILALLLAGLVVLTLIWVGYRWVTRGTRRAG